MSRKPRSDSKLLTLTEEQQMQIFTWLKHMGYTKTVMLVKKDLSISTSTGALHNFWEHWSKKESENRILKAVTSADAVLDAVAGNLPKLDAALETQLKQAAFEASISNDTKELKNLVDVFLKIQKADLDEKSVNLQVDRFQFDAAKAALTHVAALKAIQNDKGMSQTEKVDAVRRRLFSVLPEESDG